MHPTQVGNGALHNDLTGRRGLQGQAANNSGGLGPPINYCEAPASMPRMSKARNTMKYCEVYRYYYHAAYADKSEGAWIARVCIVSHLGLKVRVHEWQTSNYLILNNTGCSLQIVLGGEGKYAEHDKHFDSGFDGVGGCNWCETCPIPCQ